MSLDFSLHCPKKKIYLWIGQGHHYEVSPNKYEPVMDTFYSAEEKTMEKLHRFLKETQGYNLKLIVTDHQDNDFFEKNKEFE